MIDQIGLFLRCAAMLEADAATGYDRLAEQMREAGNPEVAELFTRFGEFSRLHLAEVHKIQQRELGQVFDETVDDLTWPEEHSPENPLAHARLDGITPRGAIETALETERRACDFYSAVAGQTRSEHVQELAQEFAEEEGEHVEHLQRWLRKLDKSE
ncbi:MAG: ferritin family protein [Pseudomonadota bacterium]|nr:MAG: ferritin family protein [Pseudomonadota bacterium]